MALQKVIITGATGAAGVALVQQLVAEGTRVTVVANPASVRLQAIPKHPLVSVELCDLSRLPSLAEKLGKDYDCFYHFAWLGTYGEARDDTQLQLKNIRYTLDAASLAAALGCKTFVGAGSQAEYGPAGGVLKPGTPCFPVSGYGIAKLAAGQLSRLACQQQGVRHIWCRILSLYGPNDGAQTMVMSGIYKMLAGQPTAYTKGEQLWDYLYSKDAARAFSLVAQKGKDGAVYCIGSGQTRQLKEYITAIRDAVNPALPVGLGLAPYYPNQVMHLEADIETLTQDTGFIPAYTFEEGIAETVEWAKKQV
ncbi:NAD(P)-dependent oxidoreductase [Ruminococcaceae bacterium OttesenSCG-928-A16]|nr:NAD(P)-dependent oxidoreductase [Ruminococcaceae bacterium OttesenSCG-928-A16]